MTTLTQARLHGPTTPGTTDSTAYTVPASTSVILKEIIIANTTGSAATVSIGLNGTSLTAANQIVGAKSIPANDIVVLALSTVLNTGDTIHVSQGTSSACTVTSSGVTIA